MSVIHGRLQSTYDSEGNRSEIYLKNSGEDVMIDYTDNPVISNNDELLEHLNSGNGVKNLQTLISNLGLLCFKSTISYDDINDIVMHTIPENDTDGIEKMIPNGNTIIEIVNKLNYLNHKLESIKLATEEDIDNLFLKN